MRQMIVKLSTLLAVVSLGGVTVQAEMLRVGGGGAAMSTIFESIGSPLEKATGISITRRPSTPVNGLVELVNGSLDLATAAIPLESMIAGAAKNGVTVDPATLQKEVIGINRTVLLVHPSNKVGKLTRNQVKEIFTGKIVSWKELGGDDTPVLVVWGAGTPGQNAQFTKEVLDGEAVTKENIAATNYASIRDIVASTPEAIGIDPFGIVDQSVKVIPNEPVVSSPIIAVTVGKPSAAVQKLINYVKGEGKQFTKQ